MSIFIFAGETSGDLHGEAIVKSLRHLNPFGVGGPLMREAGLEVVMEMEKFQVMGFVDVAFAMPRLVSQFYFLRKLILERQPKAVLFIDYPGFNLALAKSLHKAGYKGKICHYICPSVWAWGKGRIPKMEKILDKLFVIFPFENQFFDPSKLDVHFVGHPLAARLKEHSYGPALFPDDSCVIALFPGSRFKEIERNFPLQLRVAKKLLTEDPKRILAVSVVHPRFLPLIDKIISQEGVHVLKIDGTMRYELMRQAKLAIAKSGTVTLELALHATPTVVTYAISPLDRFIAQRILKISLPFYCIVNIILGEKVFPELIGPYLTEESLYSEASALINSENTRNACREKCQKIVNLLQNRNPHDEIAHFLQST